MNNKKPLFVSVYERLYDSIKSNKYKSGEKLPSENYLSKQYGVSRGTLRQALLLLQEDGLIYNKQGSGNYVSDKNIQELSGLEKKSIIVKDFSKLNETKLILDNIKFQPSTDIISKTLNEEDSILLTIFEFNCVSNNVPISILDVFIPFRTLEEYKVNLNDKDEMVNNLFNYFKEEIVKIKTEFRIVNARKKVAKKLKIEEGSTVICFYQVAYDKMFIPKLYSKTYCIPEYYDFKIYSDR